MCKKSAQKNEILGGKQRKTIFSKRNENDIKKLERSMLYHLPGPRLTDTLRLSGSEPNRAQEERAKNEILDGKRSKHTLFKRSKKYFKDIEK